MVMAMAPSPAPGPTYACAPSGNSVRAAARKTDLIFKPSQKASHNQTKDTPLLDNKEAISRVLVPALCSMRRFCGARGSHTIYHMYCRCKLIQPTAK